MAHGRLVGLVPSQAENRYLEKVKWLDMYGGDLHPVIGEDNIEYFLGLTPSGIIVLKNRNKVYFLHHAFVLKVKNVSSGWQLLLATHLEDLLQRQILHAARARQEQRRDHLGVGHSLEASLQAPLEMLRRAPRLLPPCAGPELREIVATMVENATRQMWIRPKELNSITLLFVVIFNCLC